MQKLCIDKIKIKNFRSIENIEIDIPEICGLIGPNNVGKSNVLLAIKKVLFYDWVKVSTFSEDDVYLRDPNRDIEIEISLSPAITYKKLKSVSDKTANATANIKTLYFSYCRYKVGEKKGQRRLEQKCLNSSGEIPTILSSVPKKGSQNKYEKIVGIPLEIMNSIPLIYIGSDRNIKDQMPSSRYSLLRSLLDDINEDFHNSNEVIQIQGESSTKSDHFKNMMNQIMTLLKTDAFIELEKSIKNNALIQLGFDPKVDEKVLDFFFSPFNTLDFYHTLDLCVKEGNFVISASELGGGIQNALVLAILQSFEERKKKGAIILIEEPEMFLHPQMQRSLYKTFRHIGKNNQIIYTTHSPHFVSVPNYDEILLVNKDNNGTFVTCSNLEKNDRRKEKLIKELDPERNELFFSKKLLLVEGDTEKLTIPEYAKRLNVDLDRKGITIVEVGGKRNLEEFANIAISFKIPTGIIYDLDSSDFKGKKDQEDAFNKKLDALETNNQNVRVWSFQKNYEDHLRSEITEKSYQELCQKFENTGKPTKARLIAMETDYKIPSTIEKIIEWLNT